jgi:hypothetical protein
VSVSCLPKDLDEASASERLCSERACSSGEKSSTGNRRVRHRLLPAQGFCVGLLKLKLLGKLCTSDTCASL